ILEALAYAHGKGALHRDIKPRNILLAADGRVKLTAFGASVLRAGPPDEVQYSAPEQFNDGAISARTDIYQVGAIVYHFATGKPPFSGSAEEIAHRVAQERPTDPSTYNREIAWQLDWVIQKALSKDPADRFATALDFGEGLRLGLQDCVQGRLQPM